MLPSMLMSVSVVLGLCAQSEGMVRWITSAIFGADDDVSQNEPGVNEGLVAEGSHLHTVRRDSTNKTYCRDIRSIRV